MDEIKGGGVREEGKTRKEAVRRKTGFLRTEQRGFLFDLCQGNLDGHKTESGRGQ
jgi:hypothetical protein